MGPEENPFRNLERKGSDWLKVLVQPGLSEKILRRILWPLVRRQAGGPLSEAEFHDYLRDCQVLLGLNQGRDEHGRLASYLKFRDIEFPGYGCCYLTAHNDDVASAFEVGKEVLTYRSIWEAADIIREISRQPDHAQQIGKAGRTRVFSDHVWRARLKQLTEAL